jgi:hypothetical protein
LVVISNCRYALAGQDGGTGRPDKCLVVKSMDSSLRPVALRNMESTAITTREFKPEREGRF